jgi:hypothetical protein
VQDNVRDGVTKDIGDALSAVRTVGKKFIVNDTVEVTVQGCSA